MKLYDVDVEVPANSAEVSGGADGEGVDIRGDADRKSTRLNSSHMSESRMPSSA